MLRLWQMPCHTGGFRVVDGKVSFDRFGFGRFRLFDCCASVSALLVANAFISLSTTELVMLRLSQTPCHSWCFEVLSRAR